ncbi:hypothetical protein Fmac_016746 [Flemingia macrophylla]|uniref:Uncharacterized protein n=1 Tax=Flemingia macrophylla TaxID=520843 RepID=A0ABD1MI90_9FABA
MPLKPEKYLLIIPVIDITCVDILLRLPCMELVCNSTRFSPLFSGITCGLSLAVPVDLFPNLQR